MTAEEREMMRRLVQQSAVTLDSLLAEIQHLTAENERLKTALTEIVTLAYAREPEVYEIARVALSE